MSVAIEGRNLKRYYKVKGERMFARMAPAFHWSPAKPWRSSASQVAENLPWRGSPR